ncbi:MAG: filamentous hemagglutinin N-terminal domain-containing protein [Rhodocyclaceae bacterium]|nr:filamentous hemagglutinin N-terminal domain-containing protein [Rhodocyclaceae bacterium]
MTPLAARLFAVVALLVLPAAGRAQSIATDGSVGAARELSGPVYDIPQALGRVSGGNLFHSFARFGLTGGETARFSTSDAAIARVLARVTGGAPSQIAGTLALVAPEGARPALFLLNPAGVVFTAGSAIDVPGSFHVSTADRVRFPEGDFWADPARPGVFSSAAPEAFGFLGDHSAALQIEDSVLLAEGDFDAVAGSASVSAGGIVGSRHVRVVAWGDGAGEVPLAGLPDGARGSVVLSPGGVIGTLAGVDAAGDLGVAAGRLEATGGAAPFTGVVTQTATASTGGTLVMRVGETLSIGDGAFVGTRTVGDGAAGAADVRAGQLVVDGGAAGIASLGSETEAGLAGAAGSVNVVVEGGARLANGGFVRASTFGFGRGGDVSLAAGSLAIEGGPSGSAGVSSRTGAEGDAGNVAVRVGGDTTLRDGAVISSSTFGGGDAGTVSVESGSLSLDGAGRFTAISSDAALGSEGDAGAVEVAVAGGLSLRNGAFVSSSTFAAGRAGSIRISAGQVDIDGGSFGAAGVFSDTNGGALGPAGDIVLEVSGRLGIANAGLVTSSTFSAADAGRVTVAAGSLAVDGGEAGGAGIQTNAGTGSSGRAGALQVDVADRIELRNGGRISSRSFGAGDAGEVVVDAGELLAIGSDNGLSGVFSDTFDSPGAGGRVVVRIDHATRLEDGGFIRTATDGVGPAGDIDLSTGELRIDGGVTGVAGVFSDAALGAGQVSVRVDGSAELHDGGFVSSDTSGSGDAGTVAFSAGSLTMGAREESLSGLFSTGRHGSTGDGGNVVVRIADTMRITAGGSINASAFGAGAAGTVDVLAGRILLDDGGEIAARAGGASSGQPGDLLLRAHESITMRRGLVTIENDATVEDPTAIRVGTLLIEAPRIRMTDGAVATAESSSNAPSSAVTVHFKDWLVADFAAVSTQAFDGNGGPLTVLGDGVVVLRDGALLTSVFGQQGDGGDIAVSAGALLLESGFVQANTAAADARGGDVDIAAAEVVPSFGRLRVGGSERLSFFDAIGVAGVNVIQAAAPTGVAGTIRIPTAVVDVAGALLPLAPPSIDLGAFATDPCRRARGHRLALAGSGQAPVLPGQVVAMPRVPRGGAPDCPPSRIVGGLAPGEGMNPTTLPGGDIQGGK